MASNRSNQLILILSREKVVVCDTNLKNIMDKK